MSKVIYLYNEDNVSSKDKLYKIILNYVKCINPNFLIYFFNYFFDDNLNAKDCISVNQEDIRKEKNNYVSLNYNLPRINFTVKDKFLYSIEISSNIRKNFSMYLLKYHLCRSSEESYNVNLPEVKIIEFENKYISRDKFNYVIETSRHSLSYEIPVFRFYEHDFNFIKEKKLYILFPFYLFNIYNKVLSISKIGPYPSDLKNEILNLSKDVYNNIKDLYISKNCMNKTDYIIIKDTIGEIVNYYLDSLSD